MTDVVIAPRLEDPLSDVEAVINGGYFQVRSSRWVAAAGQWVSDAWPDPINLTGSAVTVKLDASTVPYELYVNYPDGRGGFAERTEFRIVTASGTPLKWEDLVLTGGADSAPVDTSSLEARVTALENAVPPTGGTSTLTGITDMSVTARTFNSNTLTTAAQMRNAILAAPLADPAFTGNPTAPTPTTGDNDTSIATTAFVQASLAGSGLSFANAALTGTPTAPTPTAGDADTSIATTAFVDTSFAKKASPTFTGTPAVPTAAVETNTTQAASTALIYSSLAGVPLDVICPGGVQPTRPTARTDRRVNWISPVAPTAGGYPNAVAGVDSWSNRLV